MTSPAMTASPAELRAIMLIVDRAKHELRVRDPLSLAMDLEAAISNGCPMDLAGLYHASPFDFAHDIYGIINHLDRLTGQIHRFRPRFAERRAPYE